MARETLFGRDKDGHPRSLLLNLGGGKWSYGVTTERSEDNSICFTLLEEALPPREYVDELGCNRVQPDIVVRFHSKAHAERLREMLDIVIARFDQPK